MSCNNECNTISSCKDETKKCASCLFCNNEVSNLSPSLEGNVFNKYWLVPHNNEQRIDEKNYCKSNTLEGCWDNISNGCAEQLKKKLFRGLDIKGISFRTAEHPNPKLRNTCFYFGSTNEDKDNYHLDGHSVDPKAHKSIILENPISKSDILAKAPKHVELPKDITSEQIEKPCAFEHKFCECKGGNIIYYGANKNGVDKYYKETVPEGNKGMKCSNTNFGDPLYGTRKKCYCVESSGNKQLGELQKGINDIKQEIDTVDQSLELRDKTIAEQIESQKSQNTLIEEQSTRLKHLEEIYKDSSNGGVDIHRGQAVNSEIDNFTDFSYYREHFEDTFKRDSIYNSDRWKQENKYSSLFDIPTNLQKKLFRNHLKTFFIHHILSQYYTNTKDAVYFNKQKIDLNKSVKNQTRLLENKNAEYRELIENNNVNKRKIEININDKHYKEYRTNKLKYILLVIAIVTIIPILSKFGAIPKMNAIIVYIIIIILIGIYILFDFFIKDRNRDESFFKERNFIKPTDHEIARSKMMLELSKRDKEKCAALSELGDSLDPSSFKISEEKMKEFINTSQASGKCKSRT